MQSTLLIGAGMAGLAAAHELTKKGYTVTVLDKGRGVGGRMATRRIDQSRVDHGAQYFTARSPLFKRFVDELLLADVARTWPMAGEHPRYIGREGMSAIAKYMARSLDVRTEERIIRIEAVTRPTGPGWRALSESGNTFEADNLLVTVPAPQALTLLADSGLDSGELGLSDLQSIRYTPCITVMVVLEDASPIPAPGYLRPTGGAVAWVADNRQKGISPQQTALTIQAGSAFSTAHFEDDSATVSHSLLEQLPTPIAGPLAVQVHRWRYSLVEAGIPAPFIQATTPAPLLFGGDGFGPGQVEGAFLSGVAMADQLSSVSA